MGYHYSYRCGNREENEGVKVRYEATGLMGCLVVLAVWSIMAVFVGAFAALAFAVAYAILRVVGVV